MNSIAILGGGAMFLAGAAVSLLASFPISENNLYVCFVAVGVGLAALALAVVAVVLYATQAVNTTTRAERVRVDQLVRLTVQEMLKGGSLKLVDKD